MATRTLNSRICDIGALYPKVRKVRGYANPTSMVESYLSTLQRTVLIAAIFR